MTKTHVLNKFQNKINVSNSRNGNSKELIKYKGTGSQRNHYIDVLKGIAIILVVLIHTAFHSGNAYVPRWLANFTLLFEVPMFFFLAGWSFSYSKNNKTYLKSLIITQIRYMIFMVIIFILIKITNYINISNNPVSVGVLSKWMFHEYSSTAPFTSVLDSLWFFKVYFIVSILGAMLLKLFNRKASKVLTIICYIGVFIITFILPSLGKVNLGIELSYLFFYLFFYMLGNLTKDRKLSLAETIIIITSLICMLFLINKVTPINIFDMQGNKFPPNFVFLIWSSFGVVIVLFLKKYFINCKENILSKIGQNSIYVYFAQGIGASILYFISPYITMEWYYKFIIMFAINLVLTGIITVILRLIIEPIAKICKKFLNEKAYR